MLYMLRHVFAKDRRIARANWGLGVEPVGATSIGETERGVKASLQVRDHLHPNLRGLGDRLSRAVSRTHEVARHAFILQANVGNLSPSPLLSTQLSVWIGSLTGQPFRP